MAVSLRQKKVLLGYMHDDFKKYKLNKDVAYYAYLKQADHPIGMPMIRKAFKKWGVALVQLEHMYPDVFKHEEAPKPSRVVKKPTIKKEVKKESSDE